MVCQLLSLTIPFEIESDTSWVFSIVRVNRISKELLEGSALGLFFFFFFFPPSISGGHFSRIATLKSLNGGSTISRFNEAISGNCDKRVFCDLFPLLERE